MDKFLSLFIPLITLNLFLGSCSPSFYKDVQSLYRISPSDILNFSEQTFVYIYSKHCGHCLAIEETVNNFAFKNEHLLYFVQYEDNIPIIDDRNSVVGADSLNEIGIVGVPSMFEIIDKKITTYFLGGDEIVNYLNDFRPTPS